MRRAALAAWLCMACGAALAQPAPAVQVSGMVAHPGTVALAGLKQVTVADTFHTMSGDETHRWTGPLLLDVLDAAGITDAPGKKTHLQHTILARGADGYEVAVAIGEIDSRGEGKQVIVATQQDGQALPAPRLVVPHDHAFARGVRNLTTLELR